MAVGETEPIVFSWDKFFDNVIAKGIRDSYAESALNDPEDEPMDTEIVFMNEHSYFIL